MKAFAILVLFIFLSPIIAYAAQIYGSLTEGGSPVRGVRAVIKCSSGREYSKDTDNYGSYNVYVGEKGKCAFTVYYSGQTPTSDVYSYDEPVRYDFELMRQQNGQYILRRK